MYTYKFRHSLAWPLLPLLAAVSSCEKVIDFKPHEEEPSLVIEGNITQDEGRITILRSAAYNQPSTFPPLSGAGVTVSSGGAVFTLAETAPGVYTHPDLKGTAGQTYRMEVATGGKVYTAQSAMPAPVAIDSLNSETVSGEFGDTAIAINVWFTDPPAPGNRYLFRMEHNGEMVPMFYTFEDKLHNNRQVKYQLIKELPEGQEDNEALNIKPGDNIKVYLMAVDEAVYQYFRHLGWLADSGGPNVPTSNPVSNIQSGCLGYFSAHAVAQSALIVP